MLNFASTWHALGSDRKMPDDEEMLPPDLKWVPTEDFLPIVKEEVTLSG
jgi:hypothetical protein